ncbi:YihY/virulence factor BrkB family protein [Gleimia hominis]|uniref:YihY/virulence factor BrkB family protein n=1 Tax=Gleimia hominis TaxID=595468 RepID=A0ABU3ID12_9ACTO|nr:YihY/virulence factor BrkB family protein [Gleimia hominis]MDT3767856.1 YihY/virulence factor BrkB family protein [Gleimia hominis]
MPKSSQTPLVAHSKPANEIDVEPVHHLYAPRQAEHHHVEGPSLSAAWAAKTWGEKAKLALSWWKHTRVARGLDRYSVKRGNLLAGGISYVAIFSITAALTVGWTIFMAVLGSNAELRNAVLDAIDSSMPGLIQTSGHPEGLVNPDSLVADSPFTLTGFIALVLFLFSASRVMDALKKSLWSMFGIVKIPENAVWIKARDLFGFVLIAGGVLLTAVLGIVSSTLGSQVLEWLGISGTLGQVLLRILSILVGLLVDTLVIAGLIRLIAGMRAPAKDLWIGALIAGVGSSVVRFLGTSALGSADSALTGASVAIVTVLLWVNLLARIVLMSAAWMANPPIAPTPESVQHMHGYESPNYVTDSDRRTLQWPHHTMTGDLEPDPLMDPNTTEIVLDSATWHSPQARRLRQRIDVHTGKADRYRRQLWTLGKIQHRNKK